MFYNRTCIFPNQAKRERGKSLFTECAKVNDTHEMDIRNKYSRTIVVSPA